MKIIVASLPFNVDEECLCAAFSRFGTVDSVEIVDVLHAGRSKGYAVIEMPDEGQARAAIKELNGGQVNGRTIVITQANPPA